MTKLTSFDIFDTVLTRSVGSPMGSFLLLGRKLKHLANLPCSPEAFARVRVQAEARAFLNAGGLDSSVNLHNIYTEVGFALHVPESCWKSWLKYELLMESEILQTVPEAQNILNNSRKQGQEILFLSDMYLDPAFIQTELEHRCLYREGDRLYVSCELKQSKHERTLFKSVLKKENIAAPEMIHCGNNLWADVDAPETLGIQTRPFLQGNLNRYEQILESGLWETEGLSSVMAGASRLTRLSMPVKNPKETILRDVAASVASPILVHLTLWILNRAKSLGLKRLYFVSRDGQILLEIAQRLIKKLDFDCELRYLYGSRQAWLLPSITHLDEENLSTIFQRKFDVTFLSVRILLARFCLTPETVKQSLAKIQLTAATWDQDLTMDQRGQLRQLMLQDHAFQTAILEQAQQKRQIMLQYLQQELVTEGSFGLIDLGTGSTLHNALSSVLDTVGVAPPTSFYLGLRSEVVEGRFGLPETYVNNGLLGIGFNLPGIVTMLEMVCSADHGSVIAYHRVGERIEPVLKEENNQAVLDWGYPVVRETICRFTDTLFLNPDYLNVESDMRSTLELLQTEFWHNLTPAEAKVWGRFPMEDGWGSQSFSTLLARPYSLKSLFYPLKTGDVHCSRHWWHSAAFQMSPMLIQKLYSLSQKIGGLRQRVLARVFQSTQS